MNSQISLHYFFCQSNGWTRGGGRKISEVETEIVQLRQKNVELLFVCFRAAANVDFSQNFTI